MKDFITKVVAYFYYATIGPDVEQPLWERRSGNKLIHIYNNPKAVLCGINNATKLGYTKATGGQIGSVFTRLQKVHFCKSWSK